MRLFSIRRQFALARIRPRRLIGLAVIALFEGLGVFRWVNTLTACLFSLSFWPVHSSGRNIPDLDLVRREIEHMRIQVGASAWRFLLFCFGVNSPLSWPPSANFGIGDCTSPI